MKGYHRHYHFHWINNFHPKDFQSSTFNQRFLRIFTALQPTFFLVSREDKIHIIQPTSCWMFVQKDHWGEAFNLTLLIDASVTNGLVKLPEDAIIFNMEIKSNFTMFQPCGVVNAFNFWNIALIHVHKDACAAWMQRVNLLQVSESMWKKKNNSFGVVCSRFAAMPSNANYQWFDMETLAGYESKCLKQRWCSLVDCKVQASTIWAILCSWP